MSDGPRSWIKTKLWAAKPAQLLKLRYQKTYVAGATLAFWRLASTADLTFRFPNPVSNQFLSDDAMLNAPAIQQRIMGIE